MDISGIRIDRLQHPLWEDKGIALSMMRLDLIHPEVSGNKWFKLIHNIAAARRSGKDAVLTFGGAYSNHLHATAHFCRQNNIQSIGIVRGDELDKTSNFTLKECAKAGMQLHFVDRAAYRQKEKNIQVQQLINKYGAYVVPEGGDNDLGIEGAAQIQDWIQNEWQHIAVSVGSGTTIKGLLQKADKDQTFWGFTSFQNASVLEANVRQYDIHKRLHWIAEYGMGGFGKCPPALITFIKVFNAHHGIPLDIVYTGKMMYGIGQMIANDVFPSGAAILCIHTGGLQGNTGVIFR